MKPITRREAIKKGGRLLLGTATCSLFPSFVSGCSNQELDAGVVVQLMQSTKKADIGNIKLTVVYDNVPYRKGLQKDWGFSCLVEGLDKTILFDAGRYDNLLMSNLSELKIDPHRIDELVISHYHPDHIGGTMKLLGIRNKINVSLVKSFPSGFKKAVKKTGANLTEVRQPRIISKNCLSTGELKNFIRNEHSLVILTNKGSIIITGCAHPGVIEMVERAKMITSKDVLLVVGGFHLLMDSASSIRRKALRLKELGVRHVAPSHCSGGEAQKIFAEVYGNRFIKSGVGRKMTAKDFS
ncbi:MAG: MBL fold metallo-hydrolase [Thermodesulfobacteriota bacterium]|nr:MBL fold metallo-hydrolase [Thermodesulfobacteriota bacterium]